MGAQLLFLKVSFFVILALFGGASISRARLRFLLFKIGGSFTGAQVLFWARELFYGGSGPILG